MTRKLLLASSFLLLGIVVAAVWWRIDSERMPDFQEPEPAALPDPNAFDILIQAAKAIPDKNAVSDAASGRYDPETGDFHDLTIEEKQKVVEANQEALALVRDALPYQFAYADLQDALIGDGDLLLGDFRMLARLLALEREIHLASDQFGPALKSSIDCIILGRRIAQDGVMIQALTGIAISGIGRAHLPEILPHARRDDLIEELTRLEEIAGEKIEFSKVLDHERLFGLEHLRSLFQEDGWRLELAKTYLMEDEWDFETMMTEYEAFSLGQRLRMHLRAWRFHKRKIVRRYENLVSEMEAAVRLPYPEGAVRWPRAGSDFPGFGGSDFADTFNRIWFSTLVEETTHQMTRIVLALETYRQTEGVYPEDLTALIPELVQEIPTDPFAPGEPLQYRINDSAYLLYSIGPDGQDDGGQPMIQPDQPGERRYLPRPETSGDIVAGTNILRLRER